jgi:hypothetical protein
VRKGKEVNWKAQYEKACEAYEANRILVLAGDLPFDGDRVLSIILSKAFMLAEDEKIKDPSIVSQIRGGGFAVPREGS